MNTVRTIPMQEGIYRVKVGRALHWVTADGTNFLWAKPKAYVDLRSPFLMEHLQKTGQFYSVEKVDEAPPGTTLVHLQTCPVTVRKAYDAYHNRKDVGALPEIAVADLPDVKPQPEPEAKTETEQEKKQPEPEPEPEAPPAASLQKKQGTGK